MGPTIVSTGVARLRRVLEARGFMIGGAVDRCIVRRSSGLLQTREVPAYTRQSRSQSLRSSMDTAVM